MSDVTPHTPVPSAPDVSFTPEQQAELRRLIREENYRRDRAALLKLLGCITLLKIAGTVILLLLLLLYRLLR